MRQTFIGIAASLFCLAGCAGPNVGRSVPRGASAYALMPANQSSDQVRDYRIGPLDTLDVTVFQEPDLSMRALVVDASGSISMPFVTRAQAAGLTSTQLARELEDRLRHSYLHPQVTVTVTSSVSQRVTVEGQVTEPGIYQLNGPTTLLGTIAMAKGETRVSALRDVVVFRTINGQRMAAVFDIASIRRGNDPDPQILGSDVVVVGYSNARGLWRDVLQAAPLFNVFRLTVE